MQDAKELLGISSLRQGVDATSSGFHHRGPLHREFPDIAELSREGDASSWASEGGYVLPPASIPFSRLAGPGNWSIVCIFYILLNPHHNYVKMLL